MYFREAYKIETKKSAKFWVLCEKFHTFFFVSILKASLSCKSFIFENLSTSMSDMLGHWAR